MFSSADDIRLRSTLQMTTEQESCTDQAPVQIEAGTLLKQKRELLGLSQKQIADRLRLRISTIQKIENNEFESVQVATFTRGYLRSYAKAVSLDEKEVLSALDHTGDAQHKEQEMQSFSRKTKVEKHNNRIMKLTWGIFAIIAGISSLWWWQNQQQDTLTISLNETTEAKAEVKDLAEPAAVDTISTESEELVAPAVEDTLSQNANDLTSEVPVANSVEVDSGSADLSSNIAAPEQIQEPVVQDKMVQPTATATINTPTTESNTSADSNEKAISMTFTSDCWILLKDSNGKTLSTGVKKAGQTIQLSAIGPVKVILGAPEGVSMTFASEPVDLSGYTSGKVARFTLP